jgi:hypothetical protein
MQFQIRIEFTNSQYVDVLLPSNSFLDAILNYYKFSENLIPVQSFTLIL